MSDLIQVQPIALVPTRAGAALFLGNGEKTILFYIESTTGDSINGVLLGQQPERPLSHDLSMMMLEAVGGKVTKVVINDYQDEVFFARLFLEIGNEVGQISAIEIDVRPSDGVALAVRQKCPIYINRDVWEGCPDQTEMLGELGPSEL